MSLIDHVTSSIVSSFHLHAQRLAETGAIADDTAATTSTDSSDTITASDFITLLVTELKNQDPTSDQDPNAYITQLVGVNSLQQLIAINQDLTPASSTSSSAVPVSQAIDGIGAVERPPSTILPQNQEGAANLQDVGSASHGTDLIAN